DVHPDASVAHLDREAAQVVRPLVEGAAAAEVEPGVVPVAGQHAVTDAAAMEREAHVRAAVVHRPHRRTVPEQCHRVAVEVGNDATCGSHVSLGGGVDPGGAGGGIDHRYSPLSVG